ncbi:INO80 complex subunit C-like [Diaphorina citri]|uniref:INO80 complex subunit C-like n=1 Tax=Diaphorina citri TaxID=121845 RepID=A0A1S4EA90_DIACI|nr:INO80 complex subunit C-like [Diaphorina citri]
MEKWRCRAPCMEIIMWRYLFIAGIAQFVFVSGIEITMSQSQEDINSQNQMQEKLAPKYIFKNPEYEQRKLSRRSTSSNLPTKQWKSLKQILSYEKNIPWPEDTIHYSSIVAPPSFKPSLKYSDISRFECNYKDPQTKLYYYNIEEYKLIRKLPSDIVNGYLALRGALNPLA